MVALSPEMAYSQFMKAPAEHISTKHAPADQGTADMNAPVYNGKWGYTTEAETGSYCLPGSGRPGP